MNRFAQAAQISLIEAFSESKMTRGQGWDYYIPQPLQPGVASQFARTADILKRCGQAGYACGEYEKDLIEFCFGIRTIDRPISLIGTYGVGKTTTLVRFLQMITALRGPQPVLKVYLDLEEVAQDLVNADVDARQPLDRRLAEMAQYHINEFIRSSGLYPDGRIEEKLDAYARGLWPFISTHIAAYASYLMQASSTSVTGQVVDDRFRIAFQTDCPIEFLRAQLLFFTVVHAVPVVVALDNADPLGDDDYKSVFRLASQLARLRRSEELTEPLEAGVSQSPRVILTARDDHQIRTKGLSRDHRIAGKFSIKIQSPDPVAVIRSRMAHVRDCTRSEAQKKGEAPDPTIEQIDGLERILTDPEPRGTLEQLSAGSVRALLSLVRRFLGSMLLTEDWLAQHVVRTEKPLRRHAFVRPLVIGSGPRYREEDDLELHGAIVNGYAPVLRDERSEDTSVPTFRPADLAASYVARIRCLRHLVGATNRIDQRRERGEGKEHTPEIRLKDLHFLHDLYPMIDWDAEFDRMFSARVLTSHSACVRSRIALVKSVRASSAARHYLSFLFFRFGYVQAVLADCYGKAMELAVDATADVVSAASAVTDFAELVFNSEVADTMRLITTHAASGLLSKLIDRRLSVSLELARGLREDLEAIRQYSSDLPAVVDSELASCCSRLRRVQDKAQIHADTALAQL